MAIRSAFIAAFITLGWTVMALANPNNVAVSPVTALPQTDGSYTLAGLLVAPGQWFIQEAPTGPTTCCDGYRLVSGSTEQRLSITLLDPSASFTSFQATVQFISDPLDIDNIWGWVNAYSAGRLLSSVEFGGNYGSQVHDRQLVSASVFPSADRIDIVPRTYLGYTAFSYSVSAVPEISDVLMIVVGLLVLRLMPVVDSKSGLRFTRFNARV